MRSIVASLTGSIIALVSLGAFVTGAYAMNMSMGMPTQGGEHFPYGHPAVPGVHAQVIRVKALALSFEPKSITVHRGETVKFVVSNDSTVKHEFVIGDAALQAAHEKEMQAMPGMKMHDVNGVTLPPGQTRDLMWTFTRDGVVEYACHVPGHFAAGMLGKIIIRSSAHH